MDLQNKSIVCNDDCFLFEKNKEYKVINYTEYRPGVISALCLKIPTPPGYWWVSDDELKLYFDYDINIVRKRKLEKIKNIKKQRGYRISRRKNSSSL